MIRIFTAIAFPILIAWLALSDSPVERRTRAINEAFTNGKLGHLEPQLQTRLEQQVVWLARHAGITKPIAVNAGIARDRFNVVVTTPLFANLTRCGRGNAIYDAALDTIFIDSYLLQPEDLPFIGNPGAITVSSLKEFGFVVSSLNFILAHEMGHRQSGNVAAAFFALDWLRFKKKAIDQELAADRFAVRTLMQAHQAGDAPAFIKEDNALDLAGIHRQEMLNPKERAAADIMGAMIGTSMVMQFAASPYSPFFRDAAHPSFLERAADAIKEVSGEASARIVDQAPLLAEMVRRTRSIGRWHHHELHPPDPLARVEVRNGTIWVGTRAFDRVGASPPRERLYRLDIAAGVPTFVLVKEGKSSEGELPGTWLDSLLVDGDSASSLPPPPMADLREERQFEPYDKWRSDGLAYAGEAWFWNEGDIVKGFAVKELERLAHGLLRADSVELGRPQRVDEQILVPVLMRQGDGSSRLVALAIRPEQASVTQPPPGSGFSPANGWIERKGVLVRQTTGVGPLLAHTLKASQVSVASPPVGPDFSLTEGWIDVEGVLRSSGQWFVPGRIHAADEPYRWRLWRLADGLAPAIIAEGRLLASFIGPEGEQSIGRDLDPTEAILLPLGNDLLCVWFDNDSVWLIGSNRVHVAFHPAPEGLRITAIGKGAALFWIENAMKAYLVDFTKAIGRTG